MLFELAEFVKVKNIGTVLPRCDLYLDKGLTILLPDIIFIRKTHEHIIERKGIYGAPDLVIDIFCINNINDQQRKLELYRVNGIPEYITIDPETKAVWHYLLDGFKYVKQESSPGNIHVRSIDLELEF